MKIHLPLALALLALPGFSQFTQTGRLEAQAGNPGDRFGQSIAVDGDTMVVGAYGADDADPTNQTCISGAAYVFQRTANGWVEQQRLLASDIACRSFFGHAVAISGDTVAIGAYHHDGIPLLGGHCNSGAVYIYTRTGNAWTEQQILLPNDTTCGQEFGGSIAIEGDTMVIGASRDDLLGNLAGAAYVFKRSGGVWAQQQRLSSVSTSTYDGFGASVSLSGGLIAVGAPSAGTTGETYVFERNGNAWIERAQIDSGGSSSYAFGRSVAISGNTLAVAATGGNSTARVFVFEQQQGAWSHAKTFTEPNAATDDSSYFGIDIALEGDTLCIGEYGADHALPTDTGCLSGAIHVYTRTGTGFFDWSLSVLLANTPMCTEYFGRGLAIDGNTIVTGASVASTAQQVVGVAYSFERSPLGTATCFGVGCPCGNDATGTGCANSTTSGATLTAVGSSSVSADDLRVRVTGLPAAVPAAFAVGTLAPQMPMGAGLYCVGSPSLLYFGQARNSESGGTSFLDSPVSGAPSIASAGATVVFQCIYRDRAAIGCGNRVNVSNALQITMTQ